jgi:hypothetical protein
VDLYFVAYGCFRASGILRSQPELCKEMLVGAALLRWRLDQGMPVTAIEIEVVLLNGL